MRPIRIACFAALILGYAVTIDGASQDDRRYSDQLARDIGVAAVSPSRDFCLTIKNRDLKPGRSFALVWIPIADTKQLPEIRSAAIRKSLPAPCDRINSLPEDGAYSLDASKLDATKIYIAVVAKPIELRVIGAQVRGKIGAGQDIVFRSCSSVEGLHFSAWSGGALRRKRVWHSYYYLGYDVEPTCSDADFKE